MNCEAVREMLWAYLEKETTAAEAEKIEKHLTVCADCRAELELQKEMMDSLQSLPEMELPEGYHAELMQKLRAEAAPNVVPFPQKAAQKKKKQPMWKQWGMVAAAVLMVVAAGGMNGMLEMRESQNVAVQEMKAADTAEPMAASTDDGIVAYDSIEDATEDYLGDMDASAITYKSSKQLNTPAAGAETTKANAKGSTMDVAVAEVASEEESTESYSVTRTAEVQITDAVTLAVEDIDAAKDAVQKAIAAVEGYEEAADAGIVAVIPVHAVEAFTAELESIGDLNWTQKGKANADTAWRTIEIQLKMK